MAVSGLLQTSDYNVFKFILGNRNLVDTHVNYLAKSMEKYGNLTETSPVLVNEKMEVIDGQHRIAALKSLKWPVYYRVKKGMDIEDVIALNTGSKNWTWKDYAMSYSKLGNDNYTRFLNLHQHFDKVPYHVLVLYAKGSIGHYGQDYGVQFRQGKFVLALDRHQRAFAQLKQYTQIVQYVPYPDRGLAQAIATIVNNPIYDHERMIKKAKSHGHKVRRYGSVSEFLRALEEMYNTSVTKDEKVRLF